VSKAEKKRLRKLSTGGAKKRVLRELMRAKKEVTATRVKLKQISLKYKGLGKAFKTPPVLLSALKKAIAAKKLAEQQMMELNAEKHSPKAKRMKKKEIKAKVKAKKAQDHVKALTKKKKNVNKAKIKKQKHCAMPRYKKYCPASCGSCGKKVAKKATKKATKKAKSGKKKAKKKKAKKKKGKSLKDSQHSSIEDLERQLSSSISKASVAIKHAHSTVTSATSKLNVLPQI